MRYTQNEALRESLRRASVLKQRRARRKTGALSATTAGLLLAIIGAGWSFAYRGGGTLQETAFGAFLLPSERGAFILVAVAAFVVGVLVTLLCIRSRNTATEPVNGEGRPPGDKAPLTGPRDAGQVVSGSNENHEKAERKGI